MMDHALAGGYNGFAGESRKKAHAVFGGFWCFFSGDLGSGGKEIHQGDELVTTGAGLNLARPADYKRHPMSAVPDVGLGAAEMCADVVAFLAQFGNVGALRSAIVTGEDKQGVV